MQTRPDQHLALNVSRGPSALVLDVLTVICANLVVLMMNMLKQGVLHALWEVILSGKAQLLVKNVLREHTAISLEIQIAHHVHPAHLTIAQQKHNALLVRLESSRQQKEQLFAIPVNLVHSATLPPLHFA